MSEQTSEQKTSEQNVSERGYIIPVSLDRSILNMRLPLSSKNLTLPSVPVKVLASLVLGLGLVVWIGTSSNIITYASAWLQVLYYLFFSSVVIYLSTYDKAGDMRLEQIFVLFSYLPAAARKVVTRGNTSAKSFAALTNLDVVNGDPVSEDGVIHFADKTVGRAYMVVGSASLLLFVQDQRSILNDVNRFWKNIDPESEFIFLTTKEPQRIHHQVAHLEELSQNLKYDEPDLRDLLDEQFEVQRDFVGQRFKSIHQYAVIKSEHLDALRASEDLMMGVAADTDNAFLKAALPLDQKDFIDSFAAVYRGRSYAE